jgi:hypothetical protein
MMTERATPRRREKMFTPQSYESLILQLDHVAITRFNPEPEPHWFVYCECDNGQWYPVGHWFATVDTALAYGSTLDDKIYSLDELKHLGDLPRISESMVAPSTIEWATMETRFNQIAQAGKMCSQCGHTTRELLTSAHGLLCSTCYENQQP